MRRSLRRAMFSTRAGRAEADGTGAVEPDVVARATAAGSLARAVAMAAAFAVACSGGASGAPPRPAASPVPPPPVAAVPPTAATEREAPPPPGVSPDWKFPAIEDASLANGLLLRLVERHTLPIVHIELVVKSGAATDGDKPGLAAVAGELLKAGGAGKWTSRTLLDAAESLGSSLDITTDRDATRISMSVTRDHLGEALDVVAAVVIKPRFEATEFTKLRRREMDRVSSLARTSAAWAASMVLYRQAFELPTGIHPYSHYDATARQIEALRLADCKAWHAREVSPKNAFLVVAGDVDPASLQKEAERAFGAWKGEAPETPVFAPPFPPKATSIYLVDRPSSPQAEVYVAAQGPERKSPEWPVLRVTNQIVGGGVAGRLFLDVREKRSLAYRTRGAVEAFAHGPSLVVLSAGTQTAKTGLAVGALLEHYAKLAQAAPAPDEVDIATRYLSDIFLVGVDTVSAMASMTADLSVFGLPADYYDTYRAAVRNVTKDAVFDFSTRTFPKGSAVLVVVAGDAVRLGKPLSHFGEVRVVDPDAGFVTRSTLPFDPTASVELPRIDGT